MGACLELLDGSGGPVSFDEARPVDFGEVAISAAAAPKELRVRNAGDLSVSFARVRAIAHPGSQTGQGEHTHAATTFARSERGDYARELELGTLQPGEERAFWARWTVPRGAAPGLAVWAIEALGATG